MNEALLGTEPHDLSQADRRQRQGLRRTAQPRGAAQGPDHQLQHLQPAPSRPSPRTSARPSGCWPRRSSTPTPSLRNTNAPAPVPARLRPRHRARASRSCPATIAVSRPVAEADPPAAGQERAEAALLPAAPRRRARRPGRRGLAQPLQPDRAAQPLRVQHVLIPTGDVILDDRRRRLRLRDRRRELQGVPLRAVVLRRRDARTSTATARYLRFQSGGGQLPGTSSEPAPAAAQRRPPERQPLRQQPSATADRHPAGDRRQAAVQDRRPLPDQRRARRPATRPPQLGAPEPRTLPMSRAIREHLRDFLAIIAPDRRRRGHGLRDPRQPVHGAAVVGARSWARTASSSRPSSPRPRRSPRARASP